MGLVKFIAVVIILSSLIVSLCGNIDISKKRVENVATGGASSKPVSFIAEEKYGATEEDEQTVEAEPWIPVEWWEVKVRIDNEMYSIPLQFAQYLGRGQWERAPDLKGITSLSVVSATRGTDGVIRIKLYGEDEGRYFVSYDGGEGPGWAGHVRYTVRATANVVIFVENMSGYAEIEEIADDPAIGHCDVKIQSAEDADSDGGGRGYVAHMGVGGGHSDFKMQYPIEILPMSLRDQLP